LLAAAIAAVLMAEPTANGQAANAELWYHLPSVAGIWCAVRGLHGGGRHWWLAAGLCHGLAGLIKQVVAPQAAWVVVLAAWSGWRAVRDAALILLGVAVPWLVAAAALWRAGALADAISWMVVYVVEFVHSPVTWRMGLGHLGQRLLITGRSDGLIWIAAVVGAILVWRHRRAEGRCWLLGWLAVSVVAMSPGKFFLPHYLLLPAPPLALLAAQGLSGLVDLGSARWRSVRGRAVAWGMAAAIVGSPLVAHAAMLRLPPEAIAARIYPGNPFAEAEVLGRYLAARTQPEETLLIVGNEPEILFHARRRSATKFVFFYPLTGWSPRAVEWQHTFLAEIEQARPRYVVWMNLVPSFWMVVPPMDRQVLDRLQPWVSRFYGLEAALVARGPQPYALVPTTRLADLGEARVVALVLRRMA
jgi:4-amino-4-deoxy-L-arabinose transferase-like glycosyltransferase